MAAKTKSKARQHKPPGGPIPVNPRHKKLCAKIAAGMTPSEAAKAVGMTRRATHKALAQPHVKAYLEKLRLRVEEKALEKVSSKIAEEMVLSVELGDKRLQELLNAPRIDPIENLKLKLLMRQAGKEKDPEKALSMLNGLAKLQRIPIDDFILLKSVEACHKRFGMTGKPAEPANPSAQVAAAVAVTVNNQLNSGAQPQAVYESKWIREQYGIHDPDSEAVERELRLSAKPLAASGEGEGKTLETENHSTD